MTSFVKGLLIHNEVDAADGDRVYTRRLALRANTGSLIPIFDQDALGTPLEIGKSYDLILHFGVARGMRFLSQPAPFLQEPPRTAFDRFVERASSNLGFAQAYVLDPHWWMPEDLAPFLPERATARSRVLLQTPVGRVLTSHRSLLRQLGEMRIGEPFTWTSARLTLVAINGAPYPQSQHTVHHLWPDAEALAMTDPRPLPPELIEQMRQHQEWVESDGASGQRLFLQSADLRGLSLPGCQLRRSVVFKSLLNGSDLRASDLSEAGLSSSVLLETQLDDAVLEQVNAAEAILRGASLARVKADGILLEDADLTGVNAQGARMAHAELAGAHLESSNLEDADLRGSNLESAHLSGAVLTGARLQGAFLEGADGIDTVRADWIIVGDEMSPQRLEGPAARQWLHEAAQRKVRIANP